MHQKRDEDCQTKENSTVEIIEGRLKRFRTNEIDARNRLRLREEEGGRTGKTKATWKGKPTNNLKRKHRLKSLRRESKNFTRVGWILDYGLRFREEGWAGGNKQGQGVAAAGRWRG